MDVRDRLRTAEIGTKAPAIMGGHWTKTVTGWKWGRNGGTFPTPGGDWNGKLIPPSETECNSNGADAMADMTLEQKAKAFDAIVEARKSHVDAVEAYNDRLAFVQAERARGNWLNVDAEYAATSEAEKNLTRVVQDLADAALQTKPMTL